VNIISTQFQIKKAVILEEGQTTRFAPMPHSYPIWMFPLFNKPLIEYIVDFLKRNNFENVHIALSEGEKIPKNLKMDNASGIHIQYHHMEGPRGTAGILKDLEGYLCEESFLVVGSNLFLGCIELDKFI
jgi:mannose-1-phosphate guanylyltransferase/phosphomannomutase